VWHSGKEENVTESQFTVLIEGGISLYFVFSEGEQGRGRDPFNHSTHWFSGFGPGAGKKHTPGLRVM
jgi:hypothetical protein